MSLNILDYGSFAPAVVPAALCTVRSVEHAQRLAKRDWSSWWKEPTEKVVELALSVIFATLAVLYTLSVSWGFSVCSASSLTLWTLVAAVVSSARQASGPDESAARRVGNFGLLILLGVLVGNWALSEMN